MLSQFHFSYAPHLPSDACLVTISDAQRFDTHDSRRWTPLAVVHYFLLAPSYSRNSPLSTRNLVSPSSRFAIHAVITPPVLSVNMRSLKSYVTICTLYYYVQ